MTPSKLERYFNNSNYAPYYDGGREEMMREACEQSGYTTSGSDCSGFCVGLLRFFKLVNSRFDANANTLFSKYCSATSNPLPADMLSKDGHAGMYAGGGFGIESVGGGYGIQLVPVAVRRVWSFMDHKLHKMSDWKNFGKWVFLDD